MQLFKSKETFNSKIPQKFHSLSFDNMTDTTMKEIQDMFPEITTPKYVDAELEKGHISEAKANELKKKAVLHSLQDMIKKEKEDFDKKNNTRFSFKQNRKPALISVYENEYNGVISHEEADFLIDALKE